MYCAAEAELFQLSCIHLSLSNQQLLNSADEKNVTFLLEDFYMSSFIVTVLTFTIPVATLIESNYFLIYH